MGLIAKIIGNEQDRKFNAQNVSDSAEKIVKDYEELIEHNAPSPFMVYDERNLPYPKDEIKESLKHAIVNTADWPLRRNFIEGYYCLAHYCQNIGPEPRGFDPFKINDEKPLASIQQFKEQSKELVRSVDIIRNEKNQLKKELEDFAGNTGFTENYA